MNRRRSGALSRRAFLIGGFALAVGGCAGTQVDDNPQTGPVTADVGPLPKLVAALDPSALSGPAGWVSFGAGGSVLAASDGSTIAVWRTAGLTSSTPPVYTKSYTGPLALTPNGDRLFMAGGGSGRMELMAWALDGSAPVQVSGCVPAAGPGAATGGSVTGSALAISPSGKYGAAVDSTNQLWVWDVEAQQVIKVLSSNAGSVTAMAFDPSESKLVTGGTNWPSSSVWDISSGAKVELQVPAQSTVNSVALSPSGESVLYAGTGLTVFDGATGAITHGPVNTSAGANYALYSPSGGKIVGLDTYGNVSIRSDDLSAPTQEWTAPLSLSSCTYNSELNLLAAGADQGVVYVWNCGTSL